MIFLVTNDEPSTYRRYVLNAYNTCTTLTSQFPSDFLADTVCTSMRFHREALLHQVMTLVPRVTSRKDEN